MQSLLVIAAVVWLGGCTESGPKVAKVTGLVTMDGKPLPGARLDFHPEGEGRNSGGVTDEEGRYELHYSVSRMGAVLGTHKVFISTYNEMTENEWGEIGPGTPETVPAQYNSKSTLTAEVESGRNEINFDLESKGSINSYTY